MFEKQRIIVEKYEESFIVKVVNNKLHIGWRPAFKV